MRWSFLPFLSILTLVPGWALSQPPQLEPYSFTSSQVCGSCHQDIYRSWQNSMHSLSVKNQVFQTVYKLAYADTAGKAKLFCLRCHAPTTSVTKDYELKLKITQEGVTCDFCHSVKRVVLDNGQGRHEVELGKVKRGPLGRGESPIHKIRQSNLYRSSLLCAPCHEGHNFNGIPVRATYQEWERSRYAQEGKQCQDCHMGSVVARRVSPRFSNEGRQPISDHGVSLSLKRLKGSAKVKIGRVERNENGMTVWVAVTNVAAGHMIPTGSPPKRLILTVMARTADGNTQDYNRAYEMVVTGPLSKELKDAGEIMLDGSRISKDSRLAPGETRWERFTFRMPPGVKAQVVAWLDYVYSPTIFKEFNMKAEIDQDWWISHGR